MKDIVSFSNVAFPHITAYLFSKLPFDQELHDIYIAAIESKKDDAVKALCAHLYTLAEKNPLTEKLFKSRPHQQYEDTSFALFLVRWSVDFERFRFVSTPFPVSTETFLKNTGIHGGEVEQAVVEFNRIALGEFNLAFETNVSAAGKKSYQFTLFFEEKK